MRNHPLGIYEKALAKDLSWPERLVLAEAAHEKRESVSR